jgi:CBS domain-containing protein
MRVRDLMRKSPKYCGTNTDLAAVAAMLWSGGCGALPVTDAADKVVGIITDRDICVALGTRNRRPSELTAEQAMSTNLAMCRSSDDIHAALKVMRTRKIRRLPVVGEGEKLEGILCLSDLILYARHEDGSRPDLSYEDVMGVLKSIYCHVMVLTG